MKTAFQRIASSRGAALPEYVLTLSLVALAILPGVRIVEEGGHRTFFTVANKLSHVLPQRMLSDDPQGLNGDSRQGSSGAEQIQSPYSMSGVGSWGTVNGTSQTGLAGGGDDPTPGGSGSSSSSGNPPPSGGGVRGRP